jgi:hypothetical protein
LADEFTHSKAGRATILEHARDNQRADLESNQVDAANCKATHAHPKTSL